MNHYHNITLDNVETVITAINRLPMDFQVITFKDIYKKVPKLEGHKLVKEWIGKNSSVLF